MPYPFILPNFGNARGPGVGQTPAPGAILPQQRVNNFPSLFPPGAFSGQIPAPPMPQLFAAVLKAVFGGEEESGVRERTRKLASVGAETLKFLQDLRGDQRWRER